jgi:DNA-binding response OmpR family regulator
MARVATQILYVEDDEDLREVVAETLRRAGFAVATAGSAATALDVLRARRHDVVMTDLWMPRESGASFLARARSLGVLGDATTCLLTSDAESAPAVADRILGKPISAHELVAAVTDLADRQRRRVRQRERRTIARWASAAALALAALASFVGARPSTDSGSVRDAHSRYTSG